MASTRLYYTEEGVPYYFDHATGTSQWALPTDWSAASHHGYAHSGTSVGAHAYVNSVTGEVSLPAAAYADDAESSPDRDMPSYHAHAWRGAQRPLALPQSPYRAHGGSSAVAAGLSMSALRSSGYHDDSFNSSQLRVATAAARDDRLMPSYVMESPTEARHDSHAVFAHARQVAAAHHASAVSAGKRERRRRAEKAIMDARRAHYPHGIDGAATVAQAAAATAAAAAAADGYMTVHDSPSSIDAPRSPDGDILSFLGFRTRPKLALPRGATAPSAPPASAAAAAATASNASVVDEESLRPPPSPADDAAHAFIGMTLQQRTEWLRNILGKFGDTVVSQAQLLTVYLASQSLPFLSSFIETTLTGSVREARRVVRNVARAAHRALSPRGGELPLTMPRRHRSCPDSDGHARSGATLSHTAAAADVSHYSDTEAYYTAAGTPERRSRSDDAPGQLVDALFSPAVVENYLLPVATTTVPVAFDHAADAAAAAVAAGEIAVSAADVFASPAQATAPNQPQQMPLWSSAAASSSPWMAGGATSAAGGASAQR